MKFIVPESLYEEIIKSRAEFLKERFSKRVMVELPCAMRLKILPVSDEDYTKYSDILADIIELKEENRELKVLREELNVIKKAMEFLKK